MNLKSVFAGVKRSMKEGRRRVALKGGVRGTAVILFENVTGWRQGRRLAVMPLTWMDSFEAGPRGLLRASSTSTAYGPRFADSPAQTAVVHLPAVHFNVIARARVSAASSSVVVGESRALIERAVSPDPAMCSYAAGHIVDHDTKAALVRIKPPKRIERGIFLGGNGGFNYYHWLIEHLSKLEFVPRLPEQYRRFPLLVSEEVLRIPSLAETLAVFAPGFETIGLERHGAYVVDELVYINAASSLPFNLRDGLQLQTSHTAIDARSVDFLRERALEVAGGKANGRVYSRRIVLCRKGYRRDYNQDEVCERLAPLGFTRVYMEDLGFAEQVRTASHAEVLVGPTGAAWTNLLFCSPGAKAVCWMAKENGSFSAYSSLASLVGVDLRYVTYTAGASSTVTLYRQDYVVDLDAIERAMRSLGIQGRSGAALRLSGGGAAEASPGAAQLVRDREAGPDQLERP
jgi:capsular polysaccharide biosynthesis protein